jgi:hypothetical protein
MKLHGYFRSSASYRVRIALNLKGLTVEHLTHHLRKGEQRATDARCLVVQIDKLNKKRAISTFRSPGLRGVTLRAEDAIEHLAKSG